MHLEKYDRGAVTRMFAHYDRLHPDSKSNIDTANYNAAAEGQPLAQHNFLDKRLSQVKVQNRKDVNVMCDWVITAPQKLEDHEYDMFFQETYRFMSDRYGKENVISAYGRDTAAYALFIYFNNKR
ncbi:MAG: plasmid recombination protein [Ruminococcus sp.]|nr:plasmid recombination protein [Ruminococcus sp.]